METLTEKKKATKTDIQIVLVDETYGWSDKIKNQVGKIYTAYIYDKSVATHCCEITPSYELVPLYYSTEFAEHKYSEAVEEEIQNEFHNAEPIYMHCSAVEKLEHANVNHFKNMNKMFVGRESDAYKKFMADNEEYFKCNHAI